MLSRLLTAIPSLISRPNSFGAAPFEPDPEKQILSELAVAAQQGMVATRSQDHTPSSPKGQRKNVVAAEETPSEKPCGTTHKRKYGQATTTNVGLGSRKRRRSSAASGLIGHPARSKGRPAEEPTLRSSINGLYQSPVPIVTPTNDPELPNDGIEVRIVTDTRSPKDAFTASDKLVQSKSRPDLGSQVSSQKHATQEKSVLHRDLTTSKDLSNVASSLGTDSRSKIPKATHKRFDDGEPMTASLPTPPDAERDDVERTVPPKADDEAESEDEAPETITVSTGLSQARLATEEADKATKRQKAEEKRKRRERDLRLKIQAKAAKKSMKKNLVDTTPDVEYPISPDTLVESASAQGPLDLLDLEPPRKAPLPTLLPDELLNAKPMPRPLMPPSADVPEVRSSLSQKRKLLDIDSRPPKDIQRGALKVRVIPADQGHLPPKPSKESKLLRESWLTGQRGPKGGIERRKLGGGFVRGR